MKRSHAEVGIHAALKAVGRLWAGGSNAPRAPPLRLGSAKHPATIAYIQRRTHEGKTSREAIRCLKRYLARSLYRLLENPPMPA